MAPTEVPQLVVTVMTDIGFNFNVLFESKHPMERLKGAPQGLRKQTWKSDCALRVRLWCGVVLSLTHRSKSTYM
eukprot:8674826-Pyramimonas_sp.AAC.2